MTKTLLLTAVAALALSACNKENHTIVAGPPGSDQPAPTISPASLPPSIVASKSYRCKDNSVVYIDWLSDNSARVKKSRQELGTQVKVGEPGAPLTGNATAASVTYNGQACKA